MTDINKRMDELAEKAKQASERVHTAAHATTDNLQSQVWTARCRGRRKERRAGGEVADTRDEAKMGWNAARQTWHEHIAEVRSKSDEQKAEHDVHRAEHRAERAEDYAEYAVEFAFLALQEAEYAVLDASLARPRPETCWPPRRPDSPSSGGGGGTICRPRSSRRRVEPGALMGALRDNVRPWS